MTVRYLGSTFLLLVVSFGCSSNQFSDTTPTTDSTESAENKITITVDVASLETFEEEIKSQTDKVVIVDVWANW